MKSINNNLSDLIDIDYECSLPLQVENNLTITSESPSNSIDKYSNILEGDSEYARSNIQNLIKNGNEAIDKLFLIACERQNPRDFEVLATLLKNMGEMNMNLMDVHRKKNEITGNGGNNINVDKAIVFAGSTNELIKMIKEGKDKDLEEIEETK